MPTNNQITAGESGVFKAVANGAVEAGSYSWTSSDSSVTLTPSSDGSSVTVDVPAGFTGGNFALGVEVTSSDGTALTDSVTVTVLEPAATAVAIEQVSEQVS